MRERRAFTVLEVLIVVALIAIVVGLAAPTLTARSAETSYRTSVDFIEAGMTRARAEAMRLGEVVAVVARTERDGRVVLLMRTPAKGDDEGAGDATEARSPLDEVAADLRESPFGDDEVLRLLVRLPRGLSVDREPPNPDLDAVGMATPELADADVAGSASDDVMDVTLATFLPDGSAAASTAFLFDDDGRVGRIRINRWTGQCRVEAYAADSDDDLDEPTYEEPSLDDAFNAPASEERTDDS